MKYVVVLGDGMADYPNDKLGGKTPLMVANKPNIDWLCQHGELGLVKTVPEGLKPGSDVANLAMMGYDPKKCYSGRSPLEALSIGIDLQDDDIAIRCNLVTVSDETNYEEKTMVDYSAGEISTEEARELINYVNEKLGTDVLHFYPGVSYRHCLVKNHATIGTELTPPHDISDKVVGKYLPKGKYGEEFTQLIKLSYEILKDHPINKKRIAHGKNPANSIWFWGEGTKPQLQDFNSKFGLKGSVISAVDLLKGIGIGAKMDVIEVEGACGTYETNFAGKAKAAVEALKNGQDYVYIHMEAPDECGHQGDIDHKILSIELIDSIVVKYLLEELKKIGDDFSILVTPDHPTPLSLKTHVSDPVPYIIYRSNDEKENQFTTYNEETASQSGIYYDYSVDLINHFIKDAISTLPLKDENQPIVIDNTISDSSNEGIKVEKISPKQNKTGIKEGMSKKKKIMIASIAAVLVVVITLSIVLPIVFFYKDKITVSNAEDLLAVQQLDDKKAENKHIVLNKDIVVDGDLDLSNHNFSIDLNKHSLTINGKLIYNTSDNKTINIGTIKKKEYTALGSISVNKLVIEAANASINIPANSSFGDVNIKAKELTFGSTQFSSDSKLSISELIVFNEDVSASSDNIIIEATAKNILVKKGFNAVLKTSTSEKIIIESSANVNSLLLNENAKAIVNGVVTRIQGNSDFENIDQTVILYNGSKCAELIDIETLVMYRDSMNDYKIENCKNIYYLETLETSIDMLTYEQDGKVLCACSQVVGKDYIVKYLFRVNGEVVAESDITNNIANITPYLIKGGAGTYTIEVQALGNFNEDTFNQYAPTTMYLDSQFQTTSYVYAIQLESPTGLQFAINNGTPTSNIAELNTTLGNSIELQFNKVNFASNYKIIIDGTLAKTVDSTDEQIQKVDLTDSLTNLGVHSIRVIASSTKKEITESKSSMISFAIYKNLDQVTNIENIVTPNEDSTTSKVVVKWTGAENAKSYIVKVNGIELGRTNTLSADGTYSFSFDINSSTNIDSITIVAESYAFYVESVTTQIY